MQDIKSAARALGGDVTGRNSIHCPGPGHSRRDRSLQVTFTSDGNFICRSFSGDDWKVCRDHVKACLGISDERPVAFNDNTPRIDVAALADERERIRRGMNIWREAQPVAGTVVETYLASRGLSYQGDALRFHRACPFRQERHPAMIALMTDAATGDPQGVHRTALLPDGSGKAASGKMMLGRSKDSVIRLSADEDVTLGLAIAEGIETSLAVPFRPVWACMSAGNIASLPVLAGIEALTIFADNDASGTGIRDARECAMRWHSAGREVTIRMIDAVGVDYADIVREAA